MTCEHEAKDARRRSQGAERSWKRKKSTIFLKETIRATVKFSCLANWYFKPSQPLGIISGLKETFIKRDRVARTNKAEIGPEELSEKTESCRENLQNQIQLKGPQGQKQTQEQNKKEWVSWIGLCQKQKPQHRHHVKVIPRGPVNQTNARTV